MKTKGLVLLLTKDDAALAAGLKDVLSRTRGIAAVRLLETLPDEWEERAAWAEFRLAILRHDQADGDAEDLPRLRSWRAWLASWLLGRRGGSMA